MRTPYSHCHFCGERLPTRNSSRLRCSGCGEWNYMNPIPVTVLLVPFSHGGLLAVRRKLAPVGLALPGGFVEDKEDWRAAGARELWEEAGVQIEPEEICQYRVISVPDGPLLVFGLTPPQRFSLLPAFEESEEVSGREVVRDGETLVFPFHDRVASEFLALS